MIVPVILSGGSGTRLWPSSTEATPKQFLPLTGPTSLFEEALSRVDDAERFTAPIVVGSARHRQLCHDGLAGKGDAARLILEPFGRNTAAAIALAAEVARQLHGDDALLLVTPSDHVIEDVPAFHAAIAGGEPAARSGYLVTFGIRPTAPEIGYGYIQMAEALPAAPQAHSVAQFVEKPALPAAQAMIASGEYLWNAGIFMFRADVLLEELATHVPDIAALARRAVAEGRESDGCVLPDPDALEACPSESIDYAVMERSERIAVVPMSPQWSDLGSWDALADLAGGQAEVGAVTTIECANCYIRGEGIEVAALGVQDLIIIASERGLLILPKGRSQEVKRLLAAMPAR